jgi:hypothetical protein
MSGDVRIKIENYEGLFTAMQYVVAFIMLGIRGYPAKNTNPTL